MMKKQLYSLPLVLLLAACHKDSDVILREEEIPDPPAVMITTRLVTLADTTHEPDAFGQVRFLEQWTALGDIPFSISVPSYLDQSYSTVTWRHPKGFDFHTVRSLSPNDINYFHWKAPEMQDVSLHTANEYQQEIGSDLMLTIPSGSLLTPDSLPYDGQYTLHFSRIFIPKTPNPVIPSYTALSFDRGPESMLFQACIYIHLSGTSGEVLQFVTPARLFNTGTSSADPWTFDPLKAAWVPAQHEGAEDEILIRQPGYYAWAHSVPMTHLTGRLEVNDIPAPHTSLAFSYGDQVRTVWTTNSGAWSVQLPASVTSDISVSLPCSGPQKMSVMTPDGPEGTLDLTFSSPDISPARVIGTMRDCEAHPIGENIVLTGDLLNGFIFWPEANVDLRVPACQDGIVSIHVLDPSSAEKGPDIAWPVQDTVRVGSLFACDAARQEYLFLHVAGDQKMYWDLSSRLTPGNRLLIENDNPGDDLEFSIYITGMDEGAYMDELLNILFEDTHLGSRGYSLYCPTATTGCGFTSFTITHFPEMPGPWIRGTFEGRFWVKTFQPLTAGYRTVKGEFQVYREF